MSAQTELVAQSQSLLMNNYGRLPLAMDRGLGSRIWDVDGREYLDFFAGFGFGGVAGHCHPAITAAVQAQAGQITCHGNLFTNQPQVDLARKIVEHSFDGKIFYCHSGAEANEAALKIVRLAAGEGRYKIISFNGCFHGRTMGALSLTPEKYHKGFEPMLEGNIKVDYNDIDAVAGAIDDETAGIIIEPIQGEGGVVVPDKSYMQALRKLCDDRNIYMICDEVWTAPARTGKWFAYQHYDIIPDIMTLGKAIGAGLPVSVCLAGGKLADTLQPGMHGCTGGGNPLCMAAGLAGMKLIEDEDLTTSAAQRGEEICQQIRSAAISKVKNVRGAGLMIGIELDCPARETFTRCLDNDLIINFTQDTVLRIAPALTISDDDLAEGMEILMKAMKA